MTEQVFPLSVIVSFVFKDKEEANGYEPPAPPVLFQVPYDVFYPFLQNSGSTASYSLSIVFLVTTFGLAFSVLS